MADAANVLKPVVLPTAENSIVGAAFSPDSSRVAIMRNVVARGASTPRHSIQIVELKSGQTVAEGDVLKAEAADLAAHAHLITYSPSGRYLLLATEGSDVLSIVDATNLQSLNRIALHPEADSRGSLGQAHPYFRGVIGLASSSKGDLFGVLTHDELQGNEVFIGSYSSGRIRNSWSIGKGRTATQLGQASLSLSDDGSKIAVSVLPDGNSLPRSFNNLRLYNSINGQLVKSIRTDGLVGQIMLLPGEDILVSRIDTPGLFSQKTCIEKWRLDTGTLDRRFCDQGRNVSVALTASVAAGRVVGFASQMRKSIEGHVYAVSGRVAVWDIESGSLIASSADIPRLVSYLEMTSNGEWVMADQTLFQFSPAP